MYAIIKSGGKQYRVKAGEQVRVEALAAEVGSTISLETSMKKLVNPTAHTLRGSCNTDGRSFDFLMVSSILACFPHC